MSRSGVDGSVAVEPMPFDRPAVTPSQRREEIRQIAREDARRAVASVRDTLIEALRPARRHRNSVVSQESE